MKRKIALLVLVLTVASGGMAFAKDGRVIPHTRNSENAAGITFTDVKESLVGVTVAYKNTTQNKLVLVFSVTATYDDGKTKIGMNRETVAAGKEAKFSVPFVWGSRITKVDIRSVVREGKAITISGGTPQEAGIVYLGATQALTGVTVAYKNTSNEKRTLVFGGKATYANGTSSYALLNNRETVAAGQERKFTLPFLGASKITRIEVSSKKTDKEADKAAVANALKNFTGGAAKADDAIGKLNALRNNIVNLPAAAQKVLGGVAKIDTMLGFARAVGDFQRTSKEAERTGIVDQLAKDKGKYEIAKAFANCVALVAPQAAFVAVVIGVVEFIHVNVVKFFQENKVLQKWVEAKNDTALYGQHYFDFDVPFEDPYFQMALELSVTHGQSGATINTIINSMKAVEGLK